MNLLKPPMNIGATKARLSLCLGDASAFPGTYIAGECSFTDLSVCPHVGQQMKVAES